MISLLINFIRHYIYDFLSWEFSNSVQITPESCLSVFSSCRWS